MDYFLAIFIDNRGVTSMSHKAFHSIPHFGTDCLKQGRFFLCVYGIYIGAILQKQRQDRSISCNRMVEQRNALQIRSVDFSTKRNKFLNRLEILILYSTKNQFVLIFIVKQELSNLRYTGVVDSLFAISILETQRQSNLFQHLHTFQRTCSGG